CEVIANVLHPVLNIAPDLFNPSRVCFEAAHRCPYYLPLRLREIPSFFNARPAFGAGCISFSRKAFSSGSSGRLNIENRCCKSARPLMCRNFISSDIVKPPKTQREHTTQGRIFPLFYFFFISNS